jgi:stage V sporulation protein S
MNLIKVASDSKTSSVAGAIANAVREDEKAEVQAIGAGAVNRAIKATIMASQFLAEEGKHVIFIPSFVMVAIGDKERTALRLSIAPR